MTTAATDFVRATSDGDDRLVSADDLLSALQARCGGAMPGTIAVPALLELVRKARRFGLKLARPISAQDGVDSITAWAEVEPLAAPTQGGCSIMLRHWQTRPLPPEDVDVAALRRLEIDRELAQFHARLDARQCVLTAEAEAADLAELSGAMQDGIGQPWTTFVTVEGASDQQALHWRLLDGAPVKVPGSQRNWRAGLVPIPATGEQSGGDQSGGDQPGGEPGGFELYLTPDAPLGQTPAPNGEVAPRSTEARLIGRDVAPVLRQPIARIIANAETIRTKMAGPLADEYSAYAADIAAAGQHLLALIDDLTDLEVVESEHFSTAPDQIDLADVARRAAGILGVRAREQGIIVDPPHADEALPAVAEFRRVLQVLLNLLGNAIRYAPTNSQVWVRLEQKGTAAQVIVADQGPGLSDEQQARLFEKFERLGRSGDGGSGLGLYISRKLARAMGGDLTVESAPGQGARFILSVPAAPSTATG
ncbi:MAG: HAMP domain-containing sensor histidine kinase [Novosphingobium sp.]